MQRLVKSQSLFYGETEAKHARICSATRRLAESQALKKSSKACKGLSSLKSCFMARQKPSMPGSARPREGEQTPKHSKKFLRHAKAHQVSKPVLWRDQKPSMPGSARPREGEQNPQASEYFLRHAKARQVSKPILRRDRSQACQDLLDRAKASRIPKHRKSF